MSSLRRLGLEAGSCAQSVSGPWYQRAMVPSASCLWSLGGGPPFLPRCLTCPALLEPVRPVRHVRRLWKKKTRGGGGTKPSINNSAQVGPRGSRDTQVSDLVNDAGVSPVRRSGLTPTGRKPGSFK